MDNDQKDNVEQEAGGPMAGAVDRLGFAHDQIVIEHGYDDDVDEDFREAVVAKVGEPLEDEDYDGVVDVVLTWWRDGDGDLADHLMDVMTTMEEGGFIALLTPGAGSADRVPAHELQEACTTCSLTASGAVPVGGWIGQRLVGRR